MSKEKQVSSLSKIVSFHFHYPSKRGIYKQKAADKTNQNKKNALIKSEQTEDHNNAFHGGRAVSSWWICGKRAETSAKAVLL